MSIGTNHEELVELLAFYGELGVDCTLAEEAVDWLHHGHAAPGEPIRQVLKPAPNSRDGTPAVRSGAAPAGTQQQLSEGAKPAGALRPEHRAPAAGRAGGGPLEPGVAAARTLAARAKSLEDLRLALDSYEGCALRATAKNTCFYRGAARARLMIVGEAPGRDEDLEGRPFVGRAGQLLDRMLAAIGLNEELVHITNVVYWRPPGNRTPTLQELKVAARFSNGRFNSLSRNWFCCSEALPQKMSSMLAMASCGCVVSGRTLIWAGVRCARYPLCILPTC